MAEAKRAGPTRKGRSKARAVKVPLLGGGTADGIEVEISESREKWSEYELTDGTIIRMKQSPIEIVRLNDERDAEGNPVYIIKAAPIVTIIHSEMVKGK